MKDRMRLRRKLSPPQEKAPQGAEAARTILLSREEADWVRDELTQTITNIFARNPQDRPRDRDHYSYSDLLDILRRLYADEVSATGHSTLENYLTRAGQLIAAAERGSIPDFAISRAMFVRRISVLMEMVGIHSVYFHTEDNGVSWALRPEWRDYRRGLYAGPAVV